MNEVEAREIEFNAGVEKGIKIGMEKARELVKVLRWVNEYKHSRFDTAITEALAKWEAEE